MRRVIPFLLIVDDKPEIHHLKIPGMDSLAVLEAARQIQPGLRVIMLTEHGGISEAVAARCLIRCWFKSRRPSMVYSVS
jgi:DNA-binding NtrC family response regulator